MLYFNVQLYAMRYAMFTVFQLYHILKQILHFLSQLCDRYGYKIYVQNRHLIVNTPAVMRRIK